LKNGRSWRIFKRESRELLFVDRTNILETKNPFGSPQRDGKVNAGVPFGNYFHNLRFFLETGLD